MKNKSYRPEGLNRNIEVEVEFENDTHVILENGDVIKKEKKPEMGAVVAIVTTVIAFVLVVISAVSNANVLTVI